MINTLLNKAKRQATSGGGGGGSFSFEQSILFDGVNDYLITQSGGVAALTTTEFNPFNQTDWSFSCFAKGPFNNQSTFFGSIHTLGANGRARLTLINGGGGTMKFQVASNVYTKNGTVTMPAANMSVWSHYGCTVEMISASVQRVRFYHNGAKIETLDFTNANINHSSVALILGATSTGSSLSFSGNIAEANFMENLTTDAQMLDAYNSGAGANGEDIFTDVIKRIKVSNSAPQTTGLIKDEISGNDLLMNNFLSPYGVVSDTP